jgi:hypothetical protein
MLLGQKDVSWTKAKYERHLKEAKVDCSLISAVGAALIVASDHTSLRNRKYDVWMEHFELFCEFKREFGHCLVPKGCVFEDFALSVLWGRVYHPPAY